jgi:hypothetical protein
VGNGSKFGRNFPTLFAHIYRAPAQANGRHKTMQSGQTQFGARIAALMLCSFILVACSKQSDSSRPAPRKRGTMHIFTAVTGAVSPTNVATTTVSFQLPTTTLRDVGGSGSICTLSSTTISFQGSNGTASGTSTPVPPKNGHRSVSFLLYFTSTLGMAHDPVPASSATTSGYFSASFVLPDQIQPEDLTGLSYVVACADDSP